MRVLVLVRPAAAVVRTPPCCTSRHVAPRREAVELLRKLLLTSILALIAPGSAGQVVVGFVLAFIMLMAK